MTLWHILPLVLDTYRRWQAKAPFECFAQRLATKTQPGKQSTNSKQHFLCMKSWERKSSAPSHQVQEYGPVWLFGFPKRSQHYTGLIPNWSQLCRLQLSKNLPVSRWETSDGPTTCNNFPKILRLCQNISETFQDHSLLFQAMEASILTWTTILTTSNDFAFATRWPDQVELPPAREIVCLHVIPCLCPESCSRFVSYHTQVLTNVTCKTTEWSPRAAPKTHKPQIMNDSESS